MTKYEKDEVVIGYVTGIEKYGIFVNLDEYYNGLIHISEISPNFVRNVNDYVNIGETIKMRILSVDEKNHKVKLSIKNLNYKMRKRKRAKIEETPLGFSTLESNLSGWIEEKLSEIDKNK